MEAYKTHKGNILEVRILNDDGKGLLTYQFILREKIGDNENITLLGKHKLTSSLYFIGKYIRDN